MKYPELYNEAIELLKTLIATPSISREESETADVLASYLDKIGIKPFRLGNNVWCKNYYWQEGKPTLLLNSHHDTVKPAKGYIKEPFTPLVEDAKLFGLGSNDAGASLVCLLATFVFFNKSQDLPYNILWLASAEEEISGHNGISLVLPDIGSLDCAIVGEPTGMDLAIVEKGLLVLDCESRGKAGHAARNEGVNALYKAIDDINWFRSFQWPLISDLLGPVKMTVTGIEAGGLHNVIPESCRFTVDIRVNELYSHEEVLAIICSNVNCEIKPRSLRLRATHIAPDHPLVRAALLNGGKIYGSPTLSDKALLHCPTLKMGPGQSSRSHTPDEFIFLEEIEQGIAGYINTVDQFFKITLKP